LVEDLLNVSRIEGGKIQIQKEEVDLNEVIKTVISDLLYHAGSSGVLINFQPAKSLPSVSADHDKLREVLINLIGNAIKYTNKGGKVVVTTQVKGWKVITSVQDTGIGIPKEEIPNLFKKFYRVQNEMTMKREGTGLGLYITKQIVELMGGEMTVSSEFGKGSTFSFSLAIAEKEKSIIETKEVLKTK
jgi:signal transduction histidine kinase